MCANFDFDGERVNNISSGNHVFVFVSFFSSCSRVEKSRNGYAFFVLVFRMHARYRGFRFGGRDESVQPVLGSRETFIPRLDLVFVSCVTVRIAPTSTFSNDESRKSVIMTRMERV